MSAAAIVRPTTIINADGYDHTRRNLRAARIDQLADTGPTDRDPPEVRQHDPNAASPIELDDGTRVVMVGSRATPDNCGQRYPVRCTVCDDTECTCGGYHLMREANDCLSPKCRRCKPEYVPRRGASIALRLQYYEDRALAAQRIARLGQAQPELAQLAQDDDAHQVRLEWMQVEDEDPKLSRRKLADLGLWDNETDDPTPRLLNALAGRDGHVGGPYWLRHIIVSPPRHAYPTKKQDFTDVLNQAWQLAKKKGAIGGVGVLHPWRGNRDHGWREGWHAHFIAITRSPRLIQGGRTCCNHDSYTLDVDPDLSCCEGDCGHETCANRRHFETKSEAWEKEGLAHALTNMGQPDRELEQEAKKLRREVDRTARWTCDEGWNVKVLTLNEDQHVTLKAGKNAERTVNRAVLGLAQYEIEHAGVCLEEREQENSDLVRWRVARHTIRWFGCVSNRNLELDPETLQIDEQLRTGDAPERVLCPCCGYPDLVPVVNDDNPRWDVAWAVINERQRATQEDTGPPDRPPDDVITSWIDSDELTSTCQAARQDVDEATHEPHPFDDWTPGSYLA